MNGWVEFLWPLPDRNSVVFRWWWVRKLWQQSGDWLGMEILTLWKVHEDDQIIDSLIAGSFKLCRFNAFNFRGHTSWSVAFLKFGLLVLKKFNKLNPWTGVVWSCTLTMVSTFFLEVFLPVSEVEVTKARSWWHLQTPSCDEKRLCSPKKYQHFLWKKRLEQQNQGCAIRFQVLSMNPTLLVAWECQICTRRLSLTYQKVVGCCGWLMQSWQLLGENLEW